MLSQSWGLPEEWGMGIWLFVALKTLYSHLPDHLQDAHFRICRFSRLCFHTQIFQRNLKHESLKTSKDLSFKASNYWAKIWITWLHFVKKFSSLESQFWQWSVHRPICLVQAAVELINLQIFFLSLFGAFPSVEIKNKNKRGKHTAFKTKTFCVIYKVGQ